MEKVMINQVHGGVICDCGKKLAEIVGGNVEIRCGRCKMTNVINNGKIQTKTFEVRDEGTHIPVMATRMFSRNAHEQFNLERAGFSMELQGFIVMTNLTNLESRSDSIEWPNRTLKTAHVYIAEYFDYLETGSVVDVEFVLGLKEFPRLSERMNK